MSSDTRYAEMVSVAFFCHAEGFGVAFLFMEEKVSDLKISEINIEPISNKDGLIGFVSFVINSDFKICNVALHTCPSNSTGIRLVFPQKEYNGLRLNTVYPIHRVAYEACALAIANAYRELMQKLR
ncbi:MAG: hypothetical protein V1890_08075 [Candidatus Zixiibacteriota bacterium]